MGRAEKKNRTTVVPIVEADNIARQPIDTICPEVTENIVTSIVLTLLGDVHVSSDTPLMDAGVDSISSTELVQ